MEKLQTTPSGFIGKAQLALAYAPGLTCGGALNRLHVWLHSSSTLLAELVANGYKGSAEVFHPSSGADHLQAPRRTVAGVREVGHRGEIEPPQRGNISGTCSPENSLTNAYRQIVKLT